MTEETFLPLLRHLGGDFQWSQLSLSRDVCETVDSRERNWVEVLFQVPLCLLNPEYVHLFCLTQGDTWASLSLTSPGKVQHLLSLIISRPIALMPFLGAFFEASALVGIKDLKNGWKFCRARSRGQSASSWGPVSQFSRLASQVSGLVNQVLGPANLVSVPSCQAKEPKAWP